MPALGQAERDEPNPLEPLAEREHQHREQRERADDADHGHEQAAEPEAAEERHGEEEHQCETERDDESAEHDRPAGVDHRLVHGLPVFPPVPALVAVTVDHEQRVVDRDPEADHHHHVQQVVAQLEDVRERPGEAEGGRDRESCEHERQQRGARPEDEQQDHERGRDGEVQLADAERVLERGGDVVLDGCVAGDENVRTELLSQRRGELLRLRGVECRVDERGRARRQPLGSDEPPAGKHRHGPVRRLPRLLGAAPDDQDEVTLRVVAEPARQDVPDLARVGAGKGEPGGEKRRQVKRADDSHGCCGEPRGGGEPGAPEAPGCQGGDSCSRKGSGTCSALDSSPASLPVVAD